MASVCGKGLMVQVGSLALFATSTIPRVRTYHTKKPSRFVHALSARPLKKRWAGVNLICALTKARIFASLLQREKVSATG